MRTGIALALAFGTALAAPAAAQTPIKPDAEQQRRFDQLTVMEGSLTGSIRLAANQVARDIQSSTPGAMLFSGPARAKGFILDGYGPFFYVEIPSLDMNLVLTMESLERTAQRRSIRSSQMQPVADGDRPQGAADAGQAMPPEADQALRAVAEDDPGQKYRDAVRRCLIDSMLDNSKSMNLAPGEWLTIAARGSEAGLIPGEIYQLTTMVVRVKGSDLADFLAGRITRDEARQRVEVRQF